MATRDMRPSADISLDFPVLFDGETITKLTMRRPKVRDGLKADESNSSEMRKGLSIISDLVERPVELLLELDELDMEKLQEQYLSFTGRQGMTLPA